MTNTAAKHFGMINIDKPKGFTSHDVVAKLRKILNTKQIGHTGTLDPLATGVLPICIGKATKVIQYLDDSKAYRATLRLGVRSDSYDFDGEILEKNPTEADAEKIKTCLKKFEGKITQTPPMHSAVHYKGKRLYEYARKNIEIKDIPTRQVTINSIELVEIFDNDSNNPAIIIDVDCSAGTYIRSIVNDLGNMLGCGACLEGLIRTKAGKFKISDSYTIEKIEQKVKDNKTQEILTNPLDIIDLPKAELNEIEIEKISKGQFLNNRGLQEGENLLLHRNDKLCAIAKIKNDKICPQNVFI